MREDILEVAARWHEAQQHDDMDWDGFTSWLEAVDDHRRAYDEIAAFDRRIAELRPMIAATPDAANDDLAFRPRRHGLARWAIAAAALGAVVLGSRFIPHPSDAVPVIVASAGTAVRQASLPGGIAAALAPGSSLQRKAGDDGGMTLTGSAYFDVKHDPSRTLTVRVGSYEVQDLGTRFDISTGGGALQVAVAEGKVALRRIGSADTIEIAGGQSVTIARDDGPAVRGTVRPDSVGAWRNGRFIYSSAPLALVAADIARFTGQPVSVDAAIAGQPFSGVLARGDRDAMVATLGELAGLRSRRDGDALRLGNARR